MPDHAVSSLAPLMHPTMLRPKGLINPINGLQLTHPFTCS